MYEISLRVVYSMRRCGKGYSHLKRFLMLMNHPPPMSESSCRKLNFKVSNAVKCVAITSMNFAAEDVKLMASETVQNHMDTAVSIDGTWQLRGFSSLNGPVAAISMVNGKLLYVETLSRYCQGCVNLNVFKTLMMKNTTD